MVITMGPMAGLGESAAKVFMELGKSAILSGCGPCGMCGVGDEGGDCTRCVVTDWVESEPGSSVGSDRDTDRFVLIFGDFLRGRCVECRDVTRAGRDEGCGTRSVRGICEDDER